MKTRVLWLLVAVMLFGIAAGAGADSYHARQIVIANCPVTPFVYSGYSYVPLKSASDFLGAALLWDGQRNRATITYNGRDLGLVIGSTTAYYVGQPVVLPAPPIVVAQQVFVPVTVFDRYFGIPVQFDPDHDRVLICGAPGWGYYTVAPSPPLVVIQAIEGYGPPAAAVAYGPEYDDDSNYYYSAPAFVPAPFVYAGVTYLPLRDVTDFLGVALLWDSLRDRAAFTYNGCEIGLVIGSPTVYYSTQVIVLPAPPIIVHETVYVPSQLFERHLNCPVEVRRDDGMLRFKGPRGWHDFRLAAKPPGPISYGQYGDRNRSGVGLPTGRPAPVTATTPDAASPHSGASLASPAPTYQDRPRTGLPTTRPAPTYQDRPRTGLPTTRPAPATSPDAASPHSGASLATPAPTHQDRPRTGLPTTRPAPATTPWTPTDNNGSGVGLPTSRPPSAPNPTAPWTSSARPSAERQPSVASWTTVKGSAYTGPGSTPWARSNGGSAPAAPGASGSPVRLGQRPAPQPGGQGAVMKQTQAPSSSKSAPADNGGKKGKGGGWFEKSKG